MNKRPHTFSFDRMPGYKVHPCYTGATFGDPDHPEGKQQDVAASDRSSYAVVSTEHQTHFIGVHLGFKRRGDGTERIEPTVLVEIGECNDRLISDEFMTPEMTKHVRLTSDGRAVFTRVFELKALVHQLIGDYTKGELGFQGVNATPHGALPAVLTALLK